MGYRRPLTLGWIAAMAVWSVPDAWSYPLPPPEDIPEEMLQTQILEAATSELDGSLQSPQAKALEESQLRVKAENVPARLDPKIHQIIVLLRLRKVIRSFLPFL